MSAQGNLPETIPSRAISSLAPRALTAGASAHLDLIRAVAAWAVMWGHVRSNLFVDFRNVARKGPLLNLLYFFTGFGHQAVMVFFVLSGFLISSTVFQSCASGTWSWRDYAINRSSRLYVVLIPGLLFGLLWDKTGSSLFASTGVYAHPMENFGGSVALNQLTAGNFFGNLFFLQTIICPTFGSNGPLWSLSNEFWYYVLFPMALFAGLAWVKKSLRWAIPLTLLSGGLAGFLGRDKLIGFLIWMAGCGLVIAYSRIRVAVRRWWIPYALISSVMLSACLVAARTGRIPVLGSDLAVGVAFALFLFGLVHLDAGAQLPAYHDAARFLAGFSYSLYVLHFPMLVFLRAWIGSSQRWQPDPAHLFYGALAGLATLTFAWLVSIFTEGRTRTVRTWARNIVPRLDGASA
jgi:peptidoglycan/LPS O-acetylase OafA/YrhL